MTAPVPTEDDWANAFRVDYNHDDELTFDIVLFGSDISGDVYDSAFTWAETNPDAACDDMESCWFYFDGYALAIKYSNKNNASANGDTAEIMLDDVSGAE